MISAGRCFPQKCSSAPPLAGLYRDILIHIRNKVNHEFERFVRDSCQPGLSLWRGLLGAVLPLSKAKLARSVGFSVLMIYVALDNFDRHLEKVRQLKDFRWSWDEACKRAGVPDLNFHDSPHRRSQHAPGWSCRRLVRMKISGDSMERRYNIVDADDMNMAKSLMGKRMRISETVVETVVVWRKPEKLCDTPRNVKSAI